LLWQKAMKVQRLACLVVLVTLSVAGSALAQTALPKLDLVLQQAARTEAGPQRVIIRTRPGLRLALRDSLQAQGEAVRADHPAIEALTAEADAAQLRALSSDPLVESVSIDAVVSASQATWWQTFGSARVDANLLRATLGLTPSLFGGAGVGVAVIDSGIAPSLDFGGRITAFFDFTNGDIRWAAPSDQYGHGTHVADSSAARACCRGSSTRALRRACG